MVSCRAGNVKSNQKSEENAVKSWQEVEAEHCLFRDKRQRRRYMIVLGALGNRIGETIPTAFKTWAEVKAAYRFLDGDKTGVTEHNILSGHLMSTAARIADVGGFVYILHDTTEFDFDRNWTASDEGKPVQKVKVDGKLQTYTAFAILMHSACALTPDGQYLGMTAAQFWTRDKFQGDAALPRNDSPTRLKPNTLESVRWIDVLRQATARSGDPSRFVHIADRESDDYEFICAAVALKTNFLIRIRNDRSVGDGDLRISDIMELSAVRGVHTIDVKDKKGNDDVAKLEIRARRLTINPPKRKRNQLEPVTATVIFAEERGEPKNRDRIVWKLLTNLPVASRNDAIDKLNAYALRWKIEVFHKAAKSGCKTEDSQLRTAQRLTNLIALNCVVAWRVCQMTMLYRTRPNARPEEVLTEEEIEMLDIQVPDKSGRPSLKTLSDYILKIAILGGYLARAGDRPPGNIIMRRGLSTLMLLCAG
ncbi:MAG: IS4 family transposase, partial [Phycisphaerales bacterium]|nr:IS4 family transposase [Phycisphaerales bacterium]